MWAKFIYIFLFFFNSLNGQTPSHPIHGSPKSSIFLSQDQKKRLREWIEALALETLYHSNQQTHKLKRYSSLNRDCAGFVRYLLWEALQTHDSRWRQFFGGINSKGLLDVPQAAFLRKKIYPRLNKTAQRFIQEETFLLGRQLSKIKLKTGDLLFFDLEKTQHLMVLIQNQTTGQMWVVYHTGPPRNQFKTLTLEDLFHFPDTRWQPENMNPYFAGVYRIKFLY